MKRLALLIVAVALAWTAGAHAAEQADPAGIAIAPDAGTSAMDSQRDIVLAVANPVDPPPTHAGSSLLGYVPTGNYGAGQRAAMLLADMQRRYAWRQVAGWPIKELDLYCIVLEPPAGVDRDELLKQLAGDDRVQLAEPLHEYSTYSTPHPDARRYNDPYVDLQRGFVETEAARAQNYSQGASVDVAIVDTGVDTLHPDLRGRIRDVHDLVDGNAAAFNRDHHGTEVAGIIAAEPDNHQGIVGIAPRAVLSVYKACWHPADPGSGARCNSFTLAKALAAVLDNRDARVVNLSLGGPADPLLSRLLIRLLDDDRIVIAAMPPDASLGGFPDGVPGVIVVRSSDKSAAHAGVVSAPGHDILTTQPGGGYDFSSGSSMAAAHVSGIAALLLSLMPSLDAQAVRGLLLRSSTVTGPALQVNAAAAVAALRGAEHLAQ
ncbi:MAG TPA: S8 family serine peptidase [Rhodanobacteraceae bacterium]|nr:S8 family serine peptidase [Rhodanobacteraceae bacterium]